MNAFNNRTKFYYEQRQREYNKNAAINVALILFAMALVWVCIL
jgi:hypothetical protein